MGDLVTPKTDFDYDVIEKGDYKVRIKETKITPEGEGKKSGKQYLAVCTVVGGSEDGKNHFERFFEKTKDHFSLSKMAGFIIKAGALKTTGPIDVTLFADPAFEKKWLEGMKDREMGLKIGHRTTGQDGKKLDNPQSDAKAYYSLEEINKILAKKEAGGTGDAKSLATAPDAADQAKAAPKGPSVWD